MTQETLAGRIGVSYQQFQNYETGVNRISAASLIEISRALDVPISTFLEAVEAPPSDLGIQALLDDHAGRLIIDAWPKLEQDVRDRVGSLIAEIAATKP